MTTIASEVLISRLADWDVDTVYGLPGDGINGVMEGLRRLRDRGRFVLVHHEEAAAFMATAQAKATGRVGVCLATSGPGGIHLANGLYDAALDHAPVLAITGMPETGVLGTGYQQEVHLDRLFADVAVYNQVVVNPVQLPGLVDAAIRTAYARQGVAHLTIPNDLQVAEGEADPWRHVAPARPPATAPIYLPPPARPREADVRRAAEVLNAGERVAILAGVGARHAGALVVQAADLLAAPIIKTLPGKMVVPDDSPYTTGGIGLLGTAPSEDLIEEVDTLLMLGTNFPYTKHLPEPGRVRVVQVEIDPARAGMRLPTDVPLVGDVAATLEALTPLLHRRTDRSLLQKYQEKAREWHARMAALEAPEREPARLSRAAGDRLRGRWRLRHADGRVPHRRAVRAAGEGGREQQQRPRPDPVGADGARLSRVRRAVRRADAGLCGLGTRLRRFRCPGEQAGRRRTGAG